MFGGSFRRRSERHGPIQAQENIPAPRGAPQAVELALLRPGRGWFLGFHCLTRYVKIAFFRGAELRPPPPGASKDSW